MGSWFVERRLSQVAERLGRLRLELAMVDEQLQAVVDDADDQALRALVAETAAAAYEADQSRKHVDAIRRHRDHVAATIVDLEARQDELLDRLGSPS